MGSHTLDIIRQGLWASLTGGWFYDPQQTIFCNTFHLYLWLFLLCFPLTIYLTLPPGFIVWAVYCAVIGLLFVIIKAVNYALHHMFDNGDAIIDSVSEASDKNEDINQNEKQPAQGATGGQGEDIEMVVMAGTQTHNLTPPVLCSSPGQSRRGSVRPLTPADSMDYINDLIRGKDKDNKSSLDLRVDVHNTDTKTSTPNAVSKSSLNANVVECIPSPPETSRTESVPSPLDTSIASVNSLQLFLPDDSSPTKDQDRKEPTTSLSLVPPVAVLPVKLPTDTIGDTTNDIRRTKSARTVSTTLPQTWRTQPKHKSFHDKGSSSNPDLIGNRSKRSDHRLRTSVLLNGQPHQSENNILSTLSVSANNNNGEDCVPNSNNNSQDCVPNNNNSQDSVPNNEDQVTVVLPSDNEPTPGEGETPSEHPPNQNEQTVTKKEECGETSKTSDDTKDTSIIDSAKSSEPKQPSELQVDSKSNKLHAKSRELSKVKRNHSKRKSFKKKMQTEPDETKGSQQAVYSSQQSAAGIGWMFNDGESDTDSCESGVCRSYNTSATTSSANSDEEGAKTDEQAASTSAGKTEDVLPKVVFIDKSKGAIPKRRPLPPPPTTVSKTQDGESPVLEVDTAELSRRLLNILSKEDPTEAEQELRKLKEEMMLKKIQQRENQTERLKLRACHRNLSPPSSASPSERSTLLPSTVGQMSPAGGSGRRRPTRRRSSAGSRRSRHGSARSSRTASVLEDANTSPEKHVASNHNDTSEGSVHYFQDSQGNWFSYTFEPNSSGVASGLSPLPVPAKQSWREGTGGSSSESDSTIVLDTPRQINPEDALDNIFGFDLPGSVGTRNFRLNPFHSYVDTLLDAGRRQRGDGDSDTDSSHNITALEEKPKQHYNFWYLPWLSMKVRVDRLAVLALLDRNTTVIENILTVILAVTVSMMGAAILSAEIFHDFWIFLYCLVIASCQYSLLKSVQPDATSPMHGYNPIVVFSRPFYFCICCGLILVLGYVRQQFKSTTVYVYGMPFTSESALIFSQDMMIVFVLCFPLIFTIGLLPQVNTFATYFLEQIDIHIFGGTATTSLVSAFYSICRSILSVAVLYPVCFGPLWITKSVEVKPDTPAQETPAQHVLFSVFSGLLVTVSYHLSRSSSDPSVLWDLIKHKTCKKATTPTVTQSADELVDPLPGKLRKSVYQRLRSDFIVCFFVAIFVFAIHVSTVFTALQPTLHDVLCYLAAAVGFISHYLIPHLRKEMPWLCCSHPVLASHERDLYEANDAAKIMWFEKLYVWLRVFERNFLYPVVFLSGMTMSTPLLVKKFGVFTATLMIVLCGLRLLRGSFTDSPKQHLILIFTTFFFKYDYSLASETFLLDYFIISILFTKLQEFILKVQFILSYIAPWQIAWGSAFHAFAQPFSVPRILLKSCIDETAYSY